MLPHATDTHVEVDTTAGRVRGTWRADAAGNRSAAFLGIPFAEPPVGELRFTAPVPHRAWEGVRDATGFGPTPLRGPVDDTTLIPEPPIPGESTLNVNVFTPAPSTGPGTESGTEGRPDAGLPVLVYIHGGGYVSGSPASPWYDGAAFNRDGVVTVSVSYRLGFDGFGWIADAPLNRGVLDWILALEWVRDNIAAFGGDPARVTIAGQSAGGGAVLTLLGTPRAQPLFAGAYCMSGVSTDVSRGRAEAYARRLARAAGVEPTRAGLGSLDEARVLELQRELATGDDEHDGHRGSPLDDARSFIDDGLTLAPVVDGALLPMGTVDAIRSGIGADKPLVLCATDDEFSMILDGARRRLRFVPASLVLRRLGLRGRARADYLAANREVRRRGTAAMVGRYVTDRMFRTLAVRVALARDAAPTWLARFSWVSPTRGIALHCLDVPFFFDCLSGERVDAIAGSSPPQALADEVHGSALAFIATGDPGWPRFTDAARTTRVYDTPSGVVDDGFASVRPLLAS